MVENAYFTYVTGTTPDGSVYAHRTSEQKWTIHGHGGTTMTVFVQGPLPNGQYNAFAKKHLMTTTGGKNNESPEGKLSSVSAKRRNDIIAFSRQDRQDKKTAMEEFAPAHAAQYEAASAFGANGIGFGTPLTMIHCDAITPTRLKAAFGEAIALLNKNSSNWHDQGGHKVAHVNVRFKEDIIYNQLYDKNKITKTSRMAVMVMKDKMINTYHVFHGAPYDPTYLNAG